MKHLILVLAVVALSLPTFAQDESGLAANAPPILNAGAPSNGTNEVQTLTIGGTPTGGTFKIAFEGFTTGAITWSATNGTLLANINTALNATPNLADGEATATAAALTAGIGTISVTFTGNYAARDIVLMSVPQPTALTGTAPTASFTGTLTPGVRATGRGAAKGRQLIDTTNAKLYINTGTPTAPTWIVVGTQT